MDDHISYSYSANTGYLYFYKILFIPYQNTTTTWLFLPVQNLKLKLGLTFACQVGAPWPGCQSRAAISLTQDNNNNNKNNKKNNNKTRRKRGRRKNRKRKSILGKTKSPPLIPKINILVEGDCIENSTLFELDVFGNPLGKGRKEGPFEMQDFLRTLMPNICLKDENRTLSESFLFIFWLLIRRRFLGQKAFRRSAIWKRNGDEFVH